jgi:hypothetical protein
MLMALAVVCTGRAAWLQFEDVEDSDDFYSGVYGYWDYGPGNRTQHHLLYMFSKPGVRSADQRATHQPDIFKSMFYITQKV